MLLENVGAILQPNHRQVLDYIFEVQLILYTIYKFNFACEHG